MAGEDVQVALVRRATRGCDPTPRARRQAQTEGDVRHAPDERDLEATTSMDVLWTMPVHCSIAHSRRSRAMRSQKSPPLIQQRRALTTITADPDKDVTEATSRANPSKNDLPGAAPGDRRASGCRRVAALSGVIAQKVPTSSRPSVERRAAYARAVSRFTIFRVKPIVLAISGWVISSAK